VGVAFGIEDGCIVGIIDGIIVGWPVGNLDGREKG
jgi:hypothetical protein